MYSKFAYGDVFDPMKMHCGKDYVNMFGHREDEVKQLYATFPQQATTQPNDVLEKE